MLAKPSHCTSCVLYGNGCGYVPADGSGDNGVLIVAEAAGENEAADGAPLIGKAGYYLFQQLQRCGIEREGFRIHNVLSCRPPDNKLAKMAYEQDAISHCAPLLDATIQDMRGRCQKNGKHFTIVTLGRIPFKRVMGFTDKSPQMKEDYLCYPFWNDKYGAYVIAADHPSYLMRGNHHLVSVMQFAFKRALEIAESGHKYHEPTYLKDPDPATFSSWVRDFLRATKERKVRLAFDIETPHKQGKDEEKVAKEDDDDYTILRCSFAYRPGQAVSVPWRAEYLPYIEELVGNECDKILHNANYDIPRVSAQLTVNGAILDNMLAWHVLNSALPKGLGFITPFYCQDMPMWKHMSGDDPAGYNCQDSDATLRDFEGIEADLRANGQWKVFERHVVEVDKVFNYMGRMGVLRDEALRNEAEGKLSVILASLESQMVSVVPMGARRIDHIYVNEPKDKTGLLSRPGKRIEHFCSHCGISKPRKDHFKRFVKKLNPCADDPTTGVQSREIEVVEWYRLRDWKLSVDQLSNYQAVLKHRPILDKDTKSVTFDEKAVERLMKAYPKDPLYPLIIDFRGNQKLYTTYVGVTDENGIVRGGMPVDKRGRICTLFTHNPSTLRSASQNPNLQNLPRPKGVDDLATIIRNLIIAGPGCIFTARDYSGIEAVLVGYFALSARYIRLAKIDVHSFYTAYALHELDGRVRACDLPDFNWPDDKLIPHLAAIKKEFKSDRNNLYKHLVHGANFFQGALGAREKIFLETGIEYEVKLVKRVMDIYFALFPEIRKWHNSVMLQADRDGYLRNPFGYVHRFNKVYDYEKIGGTWRKNPGPQANECIAFLPQSTAAAIIKEAMLRLHQDRFEEAGQYLRLLVHDELLFECPIKLVDIVDNIVKEEMEKPIPELALPVSYQMGPHLTILTEPKAGVTWGTMK